MTETVIWDLTDKTQESNEQWEVGQTFFQGQQVTRDLAVNCVVYTDNYEG